MHACESKHFLEVVGLELDNKGRERFRKAKRDRKMRTWEWTAVWWWDQLAGGGSCRDEHSTTSDTSSTVLLWLTAVPNTQHLWIPHIPPCIIFSCWAVFLHQLTGAPKGKDRAIFIFKFSCLLIYRIEVVMRQVWVALCFGYSIFKMIRRHHLEKHVQQILWDFNGKELVMAI